MKRKALLEERWIIWSLRYLDPKLKRWETGLVCDKCRRKAVALTLVKRDNVWDRHRWSRRLVGKKVCYSCLSATVGGVLYFEDRITSPISSFLLVASLVTFVGFTLSWGLGLVPTIRATLLFLFVTPGLTLWFAAGRAQRRRIGYGRWLAAQKLSTPLVGTEGLFEEPLGA